MEKKMANISYADGTITVEGIEDVVELLKDFENYTDENGVAYDVRKEYEKVLAA